MLNIELIYDIDQIKEFYDIFWNNSNGSDVNLSLLLYRNKWDVNETKIGSYLSRDKIETHGINLFLTIKDKNKKVK